MTPELWMIKISKISLLSNFKNMPTFMFVIFIQLYNEKMFKLEIKDVKPACQPQPGPSSSAQKEHTQPSSSRRYLLPS